MHAQLGSQAHSQLLWTGRGLVRADSKPHIAALEQLLVEWYRIYRYDTAALGIASAGHSSEDDMRALMQARRLPCYSTTTVKP